MGYQPTESLDVTWKARNTSWRQISTERRDVVIDLPVRMRGLSLSNLPDDMPGRKVASWCKRWHPFPSSGIPLDFDAVDFRGTGMLLWGPPGTGKTTLAAIAAQYISDLGWSTKFVRAQDFYSLGIQAMRIRDEDEKERMQSAVDCYEAGWSGWRLVVVDDLGREHSTATGWSENAMENLFRARFTDAAPTIVTTNLDPDGIGERYGDAMGDYIHEAFWVIEVGGESRRRGR